jgi:hypothetical protein
MADNWKSTSSEVFRLEHPNDAIEGTLVSVRDGNYFRPDGGKSKVFDIQTTAGIKSIFGSMILERMMASVKIGSAVKIVYKGTVTTRTGRAAKNYEVFTK